MANATKTDVTRVITPLFRVSFPHVFEPQTNDDGKEVYGVTAIFDSDADLKEMKALVKKAAEKKWPGKELKWGNERGQIRSPLRRDDTHDLEKYPEYEGKITAGMRSYGRQPGLVGPDKKAILDKRDFYSGCYAIAEVTAFAYEQKGNKGVSFGLSNVMKMKDGEPLAAGVRAEVAFEKVKREDYGITDNSDEFDNSDDNDDPDGEI